MELREMFKRSWRWWLVGAVLAGLILWRWSSISRWMVANDTLVDGLAAIAQVLLTIALVVVTVLYVRTTNTMSRHSKNAAEAASQSAKAATDSVVTARESAQLTAESVQHTAESVRLAGAEMRPYVVAFRRSPPEHEDPNYDDIVIENIGRTPAFNIETVVETQEKDAQRTHPIPKMGRVPYLKSGGKRPVGSVWERSKVVVYLVTYRDAGGNHLRWSQEGTNSALEIRDAQGLWVPVIGRPSPVVVQTSAARLELTAAEATVVQGSADQATDEE